MLTVRKITFIVFIINIILTCFTLFLFFQSFRQSIVITDIPSHHSEIVTTLENISDKKFSIKSLEIWSKAAIGEYIWQHVLLGKIDKRSKDNMYAYGSRKINNWYIKFRTGPLLSPYSLQSFLSLKNRTNNKSTNILLILNARSDKKVTYAKQWLDEVYQLHLLKNNLSFNIGAILLGNEYCFNNWLKPYLSINGGPLSFIFIVYDWKEVNNKDIYQWPLGVATYRQFPEPSIIEINYRQSRPYVCNYIATIYLNTSREELLNVVKKLENGICFVKPRMQWEPSETEESLQTYIKALSISDLTLSPIGMNHESYRIYEALSYGSIPVLEENLTHVKGKKSNCDNEVAFRLLKKYKAPVFFVANWTLELPLLIEKEINYSQNFKINRRLNALKWYNDFKIQMKDNLLNVIEKSF